MAVVLNVYGRANLSQIEKAEKQLKGMKREVASQSGTWSKFGNVVSSTGAKIASGLAAAGITRWLVGSVEAAHQAEVTMKKLETTIASTGVSWADYSTQMQVVVDKQSMLSAYSGGELKNALSTLTQITGSASKGLDLLGLSTDLARAKNIDLGTASKLVGKVAAGNTSALSRYGIVLKKGATTQQALAAMQKRFAGQAKAYGDSSAGAQAKLGNALKKLQVTVGTAILPALTALSSKLVIVLNAFQGLPGPVKNVIVGVAAVATAGLLLAPFVESIIAVAKAMKLAALWSKITAAATKVYAAAQWLLNAAMSANPILLVVLAVVALTAVFILLWKKCDWFRNFWIGLWKGIVAVAKAVWNWMKPGFEKIWSGIKFVWHKIAAAVKAFWNWASPYIKLAVSLWWLYIKTYMNVITTVVKVAWKLIVAVVKRYIENIKIVVRTIITIVAFVRSVFNAIRSVATTIGRSIAQRVGDIWRGIKSTAKTVWDGVTAVVKTAWNNIAGFVNKIIGAFNWVISKVPGLSGKSIPQLPTGDDSRSSASIAGAAGSIPRRSGDDSRPKGIGDFTGSVKGALSSLNPMHLLDEIPWPDVPGGMFGDAAGAVLKLVKDAVSGLVKRALSSVFGGTGSGSAAVGGSGYAWAYALAKRFGLYVTSTFRPGAITAAGNASDHGVYGRAADIAGSLGGMGSLWNYVKSTAGSWKQAIYQHQMVEYGRLGYYGPSDHFDHVHLARATGGDSRSAAERRGSSGGDTYVFDGCLFAQDFDTVIAEANQRGSVKIGRRIARTRAVR